MRGQLEAGEREPSQKQSRTEKDQGLGGQGTSKFRVGNAAPQTGDPMPWTGMAEAARSVHF